MARLWSSGFELNSATNSVEWDSVSSGASIQSSVVRSGTYAGLCSTPSGSNNNFKYTFAAAATSGSIFVRAYIYFTAFPTVDTAIFQLRTGSNGCRIHFITATNKLRLVNPAGTAIGSDSAALSLNTWYCVEQMQNSGTTTAEARLNGSSWASSSSVSGLISIDRFYVGVNTISGLPTATMYVDDVAINDSSGSFQTSWPGEGKIIHLRPSATGDIAGFVRQGADSGANWSQVSEVTPNDITAYNNSTTLNAEDLFNVDNCGLNSYDVINLVALGVRMRGNSAVSVPTINLEIEKTSGGTVAQGSNITANSTTWRTNANATPFSPTLTAYQDPDAAAWTQATLDSMQIGYKLTVDSANRADISTVWALVDYTPGSPPPSGGSSTLMMMGI